MPKTELNITLAALLCGVIALVTGGYTLLNEAAQWSKAVAIFGVVVGSLLVCGNGWLLLRRAPGNWPQQGDM